MVRVSCVLKNELLFFVACWGFAAPTDLFGRFVRAEVQKVWMKRNENDPLILEEHHTHHFTFSLLFILHTFLLSIHSTLTSVLLSSTPADSRTHSSSEIRPQN